MTTVYYHHQVLAQYRADDIGFGGKLVCSSSLYYMFPPHMFSGEDVTGRGDGSGRSGLRDATPAGGVGRTKVTMCHPSPCSPALPKLGHFGIRQE